MRLPFVTKRQNKKNKRKKKRKKEEVEEEDEDARLCPACHFVAESVPVSQEKNTAGK